MSNEKYEIEAINIYNKIKGYLNDPNNAYKFFDCLNTLLSDNKKYMPQEIEIIKRLVFRNLSIDFVVSNIKK